MHLNEIPKMTIDAYLNVKIRQQLRYRVIYITKIIFAVFDVFFGPFTVF